MKEFTPSRAKPAQKTLFSSGRRDSIQEGPGPIVTENLGSTENLGQLGLDRSQPNAFQSQKPNASSSSLNESIQQLAFDPRLASKGQQQVSFELEDGLKKASLDDNSKNPDDLISNSNNQSGKREETFDLNARIDALINEQKKNNEILQTAIKSLCQAYYATSGCSNN